MGAADERHEARPSCRGGDRPGQGIVGVRTAMAEPNPTFARAGYCGKQLLGKGHGLGVGRADITRRRHVAHGPLYSLDDGFVGIAKGCSAPCTR